MRRFTLLTFVALISSPAFAVENEAPAAVQTPAVAEAPPLSASAPSHAAAAPEPDHAAPAAQDAAKPAAHEKAHSANASQPKDKAAKKPETAQKPALTKQAYARLLAAEIRRHTPKSSENRTGSVNVAFTVNASGRIVSHKVQNSSNPALEPVIGQILASVHAPPPPGGSFSAVQAFNFR